MTTPFDVPFSCVTLLIALFLSLAPPTYSSADVSFTLISFSNPDNKLLDGSYCKTDQSPCLLKFMFSFKKPVTQSIFTGEVTASTVSYPTGASAITTYNGKTQPNPFPADPATDNAISTLEFEIRVFDYSSGGVKNVATFAVDEDVKFQTQVYNLTSGYSTFILSSDITCHTDYYGDCTIHCVAGATYTCDPATGSRVCKAGWTGADCATKVSVPCSVQSVSHGSYSPQTGSYTAGDSVIVTCNTGYLPPSSTLTCQNDGTWSPAWPTCAVAECVPVTALPHGTVSPVSATSSPSSYQNTVSFSCNAGYRLSGEPTLTCQADATWDHTQPSCQQIRCPPITLSAFQTISPSNKNFSTSAVDETVSFYCTSGYTLVGSQSLKCLADGTWDGPQPKCTLIQCPFARQTTLVGGLCYYASRPPPRTPDNVFHQMCFTGYVGRGSQTRTCLKNGTWDKNDVFVCLKECAKLTYAEGVVTYTSETPAEGTTATFSCSPGHFLQGERGAECQADGTWNITRMPSCVPGCTVPHTIPADVTVSPATFRSDEILVGYTLSFTCPRDCFLSSQPHSTCTQSGEWDAEFPSCVPFVEDINATVKDLYIAGLSTISGVFVVFVLTVFTLVYFDRKVTKKSKTTTRKLSYAIAPNPLAFNPQNSFKMQSVVSPAVPSAPPPAITKAPQPAITRAAPPAITRNYRAQNSVNSTKKQTLRQTSDGSGVKKFVYKNPSFVKDDF